MPRSLNFLKLHNILCSVKMINRINNKIFGSEISLLAGIMSLIFVHHQIEMEVTYGNVFSSKVHL